MVESTVSTKLSLAICSPSLTVSVIVAVPVPPAAGVSVTVRFAPAPPNTMPLTETSDTFDEPADIVKVLIAVSASPTVTVMAGVGAPIVVVWLATSEMVGALPAVTVSWKLSLAVDEPSVTARIIGPFPTCAGRASR